MKRGDIREKKNGVGMTVGQRAIEEVFDKAVCGIVGDEGWSEQYAAGERLIAMARTEVARLRDVVAAADLLTTTWTRGAREIDPLLGRDRYRATERWAPVLASLRRRLTRALNRWRES